jgi:hypothetical protein
VPRRRKKKRPGKPKGAARKKKPERQRKQEKSEPSLTFLLDECCLGKGIQRPLAKADPNSTFVLLLKHFPKGSLDQDWIPEVAQRGWIILTKDARILRNKLEIEALRNSKAIAFVLTAKGLNAAETAEAFVKALPRMKRLVLTHTRPTIATVSASGLVTVREGKRRGGVKKKKRRKKS